MDSWTYTKRTDVNTSALILGQEFQMIIVKEGEVSLVYFQ